MFKSTSSLLLIAVILSSFLLYSCDESGTGDSLFQQVSHKRSGITFKNTLRETEDFNVLIYSYFYNGGGVATGDLNNDGLCDVFFTGNLVASHLYLNKGDWKFENIAKEAGIEAAGLWNTGVTMADVNQDGWLDIYICRSAARDPDGRRNLLFINQGSKEGVSFKEEANKYGLDDPAYSTQASFFDYDRDGDLDMFLLNHSVPEYANFTSNLGQLKTRPNDNYSDKLYRNDGGTFTNVSKEAGLKNNVLGFGLGIAISDLNGDMWPDIYVSNDYNEEDYLYINQKDGTFEEQLDSHLDYTSLFSMGSDLADINNDGMTDIVTLDMLPQNNYRVKLTSGADNFNKYRILRDQGFHKQSMRNMLHLNQGNGSFTEVGQMAGVSNSDWSWSALVADYDLDGWQDLFVTNGYLRDYTNMEFLSYAMDLKLKGGEASNPNEHIQELLKHIPKIDVPNKIYKNQSGLAFQDSSTSWGFTKNELSNGASYADLDNDGDLDLVINNVNDFAGIYRNNAVEKKKGHFLNIVLTHPGGATGAMGSHVMLCKGEMRMHRSLYLSRGFQSSVEPKLFFGLGDSPVVDSLIVNWPDGSSERFIPKNTDTTIIIEKDKGIMRPQNQPAIDHVFEKTSLIAFRHVENDFNDFRVQGLLPLYYSRMGPSLCTGDINQDGIADMVCGGAEGQSTQVFLGTSKGDFRAIDQPALLANKNQEDVDIVLQDLNGDSYPDLVVATGGNAHPDGSDTYLLRIYLNDRRGNFKPSTSMPEIRSNASSLAVGDINHDGHQDIFLGSIYRAQEYPLPGRNYLLLNDGVGNFSIMDDVPFASHHVSDATITDYDQDGNDELVMVGEWEPLRIYSFVGGAWSVLHESREKGWYNTVTAVNLDADPEMEFVVGNMGLNNQWDVEAHRPMILYYGDFDKNNTIDPILSSYDGDISYPFVSRDDLTSQMPSLKKYFTNYTDYATMEMNELLTKLPNYESDTITDLRSVIFDVREDVLHQIELPDFAQVSPVYVVTTLDFNNDERVDLLLTGNNEFNRVKLGEMDANHGILLKNTGDLRFEVVAPNKSGLNLKGDVRSAITINNRNGRFLVFGINNEALTSYQFKGEQNL